MNHATHPEAQPLTPSRWNRMAWLPILLLLAAIITARMAGLRDTYESHALLMALSFTFYTLVSLGTLYIIGRSFLGIGSPGLLLLECGVILWSLAGTVGDFASHGDANINVTIFNTGILLAGLCHLAGTILALRSQRVLHAKPLWLGAGCALTLGTLWLVSQAALQGWLPVFFIPGQGGTPVRYLVLSSAIAMFVLSAGLLKVRQCAAQLPFTYWYALALLMLAVGLFGVMIQLSLGSVVNWLSRTAQWLGGIYLLFAALASLRESQLPLLPSVNQSNPAYYRDAIAVAMVLATVAIRLTFLSALGMQAPFVTFFPAVTLASMYGGLRAGLLATALSAIFAGYFWIEPTGFTIGRASDWLALTIFLLSSAMIAGVSDAMNRARVIVSTAEKQALLANERRAAAEALQEGRAKLEAALDSMTDAVFISDVQGRFIDFNDAFATFHRFRNKGECSKTFAEYPDILDVFMADGIQASPDQWAVPRALRGETATNAEYTLRRKDTGETWVGSYSFGPIRNKDGVIVGSVVTARDITESKRAEEALQRSEERYRTLFNGITEGFAIHEIITDERDTPVDWRFLDINPAFERLTGLKREDVVGKTHNEVLPGDDPKWLRMYAAVALTGEPVQFEDYSPTLKRHYSVLAYLPAPRQFAVIFTDITELKDREKEQEKSNRTLRALNRSNQAMIQATDERAYMEEVCRIVVEDCGHAMVWIGFAEDDENKMVRPVAYSGLEQGYIDTLKITWADSERGRGPTGTAIREGKTSACRNMLTDPVFKPWREEALKRGYASSIVLPMMSDHKAFGALTIYSREPDPFAEDEVKLLAELASDLSYGIMAIRLRAARERAEKALNARTVQLENTNKELESFSYSVSHDLRAPLRAIDGYARMILRQQGDKFDETTRHQFDVIRNNTKMMGQLIEDLLALSRLGQEALSRSRFDVKELTRDVWEELKANNPDRSIDVKIHDISTGHGDRSLIKQVLINLLSNAIKFTRDREDPLIEVGGTRTKTENVYFVRDNGVGFDMQYHDKLFGVFQRLHSASDYEGTGVGLAIVQRIVHRHGGRIWAEGEVGKGATFYFTLPAQLE